MRSGNIVSTVMVTDVCLDRKHCRLLVELLTGHINLRYMLHKMERMKTTTCRTYGAEKETLVHILCNCLALEKEKTEVLDTDQMDPDQFMEVRLSGIVALGMADSRES